MYIKIINVPCPGGHQNLVNAKSIWIFPTVTRSAQDEFLACYECGLFRNVAGAPEPMPCVSVYDHIKSFPNSLFWDIPGFASPRQLKERRELLGLK